MKWFFTQFMLNMQYIYMFMRLSLNYGVPQPSDVQKLGLKLYHHAKIGSQSFTH